MNRKKVLVIDDSELVLEFTCDALTEAGYDVVTLDRPLGSSNIIAEVKPILVLLDLDMPALNGEKLLRLFRKFDSLKDTLVVLYSDRPLEELKAAAERSGADGVIRKTGDADELVRQVAAFVAQGEYA